MVSQIMEKHVVAVSPETSAENALKLMNGASVDLLPVLKDGRLVGILYEYPLEEALTKGQGATAEAVMQGPLCVEGQSSVDEAVKYLIEHNLSRLPVVESMASMRCIGIVGSTELLRERKQE